MTEEEAAALSASMMAKAKASVPAPSAQDAKVAEAPSWLAQSLYNLKGKVVGETPTQEDVSPVLKNVGNEVERALSNPIGGSPLTALLLPLLTGGIDTMQNTAKRTGNTPLALSGLTTALDSASFGLLDKGIAHGNTRAAVDAGEVAEDSYNERYAEELDMERLDEAASSAANPATAMAGSVLGAIATGGGVAKGGLALSEAALPAVTRAVTRSAFGKAAASGAAASTEAATYRMNKDGSLKAVAIDAGIATLGGAAASALLTGLGAGARKIRKTKLVDDISEDVGTEILRLVNNGRKGQDLPVLSAVDVQRQVESLGEGATLLDAFPALEKLAKQVIGADLGFDGYANKLHGLVAARNEFFEDFLPLEGSTKGILSDVLGESGVRSPKQFATDMKARFTRLSPRYTEVFKANQSVTYSIAGIRKDLDAMFGDKSRWTTAQHEVVEGIKSNIDYFVKQTTAKTATGSVKQKALTLEQVNDLKGQLEGMAADGALRIAGPTGRVLPLANKELFNVANVANYFVEKLNATVPELATLNAVYGNVARVKGAYRAGQEIMAETGTDKAAFNAFLANTSRSAAERRAFVEGAKQKLFVELREKAQNPDSMKAVANFIQSGPTVAKLKALLGDKEVDTMVETMLPHIKKTLLADRLRKTTAAPKLNTPQKPNSALSGIIDALIAGGGPLGITSKGATGGALQRLVGRSSVANETAGQNQMFGEILPAAGQAAGNAYGALQQLLSRTVRPSDAALITKGAAGGAALSPSVGGE